MTIDPKVHEKILTAAAREGGERPGLDNQRAREILERRAGLAAVVYDAAVPAAADQNDRWVWAEHRARLEFGIVPSVPSWRKRGARSRTAASQGQICSMGG